MHGSLSSEAMLVAIALLPAPEVPTTTTRIGLLDQFVQAKISNCAPEPQRLVLARGGKALRRSNSSAIEG
jgi:hypothetical protein